MTAPLYREQLKISDRHKVFDLLQSCGYFLPREMAYGMDLFDEYLRKGDSSNYQFLLHEQDDHLLAYGCYGLLPLTDRRYHLHWLVVNRNFRGNGYGRKLEAAIAERIVDLGGRRIYAEFSNRGQHKPMQAFYEKCGYQTAATIPDYYADGDHKVLYVKNLIAKS